MSLLRFVPELPLLRRELIELANRRRTYIIRFAGAIVLLAFVMISFQRSVGMIQAQPQTAGGVFDPNPFRGTGGLVFREIVSNLFVFVQVLMPALICGSITLEKERNTLGTLFVTRLSPMTIILEKLGSRLLPMLTFLLLTFPLLAFVYSLGGVDTRLLVGTLWLLFCECLLYASLGLMCSSWFQTTVTAFIWSYVLTGLLLWSSLAWPYFTPHGVWRAEFMYTNEYGFAYSAPPDSIGMFDFDMENLGTLTVLVIQTATFAVATIPSLFVTCVFLLLARVFLIRRAFVTSTSLLLRVFKRVDVFFNQLNDRTTGGVVLIRDYDSLPAFDPVAWRERAKKSLGKARYLFRILVVMEVPTLFICASAAEAGVGVNSLRGLLYTVWAIAAIILAVKASTMISSERARETIDALLSTPMSAREIVEQKIAGMKRLMIVLSIPIMSIHFTLLLMHFDVRRFFVTFFQRSSMTSNISLLVYSGMTLATTFTLMHLISWLSALMGMRSQSQSKSVMAAVTAMVAWLIFCIAVIVVVPFPVTTPYWLIIRPDISIQANEAILAAIYRDGILGDSTQWFDIFHLMASSPGEAIWFSLFAFAASFGIKTMLKRLTLRLAPWLLQRRDETFSGLNYTVDSAVSTIITAEPVA